MSVDAATISDGTRRSAAARPLKQLVALLLFAVVGFSLAAPCLCIDGAIRGRFTMAFTFLVFCRLAWQVHRRTFRFKDYFLYFGFAVAFCIWAELQCGQ
jgi:hypothetical protein